MLRSITDQVLGFLFPDRCAGCGRSGSLFCAVCRSQLHPYAARKHLSLGSAATPALDDARVAFVFEGPLREAIHCLKYTRIRRVAEPLGDLLAEHLCENPLPSDGLVPVPLHPKRLAERGFNQSELLGQRIARAANLPLIARGLVRRRDTAHQVGLDARARQENIQGAFDWRFSEPPPARVLLLDDVLTTGATLNACAEALRAAGVQEVRALALAGSQPGSDQ